jgi:hypothetical protein
VTHRPDRRPEYAVVRLEGAASRGPELPGHTTMSTFEIIGLVIIGVGFLGLIAYVARHARQWDDE